MRNLIGILTSLALFLIVVFPPYSQAHDYPSRSIRIICPYPPGGFIDTLLNRELTRAIPEIRAKFPDTGATWGGSTAVEVTAAIRRESAQWGALIRKLGLKSQ